MFKKHIEMKKLEKLNSNNIKLNQSFKFIYFYRKIFIY